MSDDNVVAFPGSEWVAMSEDTDTHLEIEALANGLIDNDVEMGVFVGRKSNGTFYFASTSTNIGKLLVLLEAAKSIVVDQIDTTTD